MKDIKILLSSLLIIAAFFCGYLFKSYQDHHHQTTQENTYVNLQVKGKKIELQSDDPSIILLINGEETSSGSIILK